MTIEILHRWVEHFIKISKKDDILVWDNLAAHKNKEVNKKLKDHGIKVILTPPYMAYIVSPLENNYFGQLKQKFRTTITRTWSQEKTKFQSSMAYLRLFNRKAAFSSVTSQQAIASLRLL